MKRDQSASRNHVSRFIGVTTQNPVEPESDGKSTKHMHLNTNCRANFGGLILTYSMETDTIQPSQPFRGHFPEPLIFTDWRCRPMSLLPQLPIMLEP
jgi:hypothetical protein